MKTKKLLCVGLVILFALSAVYFFQHAFKTQVGFLFGILYNHVMHEVKLCKIVQAVRRLFLVFLTLFTVVNQYFKYAVSLRHFTDFLPRLVSDRFVA